MSDVKDAEIAAITVAPRITPDMVKGNIKSESYFRAIDGVMEATRNIDFTGQAPVDLSPLKLMTFCVLVLQNGFTVTGQSACASPENYNEEIGNRLAKEDAKNKIWAFMAYDLRSKLTLLERATPKSNPDALTYVGTKVVHAVPMTRGAYNLFRGWTIPVDEDADDQGYMVEYSDGGVGNIKDYTGYISWSSRDTFEATYKNLFPLVQPSTHVEEKEPEIPAHIVRMAVELKELEEKQVKLLLFSTTDIFKTLDADEQHDMKVQEERMGGYANILRRRLIRAEGEAEARN